MKSLLDFYNDKETKENVHSYLLDFLKEEALRRVFDKEDVSGVAEAKEVIGKAFENLDTLFAPKPKEKEPINEAR